MKQNDHKPTRSAICSITFKLNPKLSPRTTCQLQQTTMIQKYSFPTLRKYKTILWNDLTIK